MSERKHCYLERWADPEKFIEYWSSEEGKQRTINEWCQFMVHMDGHRTFLVEPRVDETGIYFVEQEGSSYIPERFARNFINEVSQVYLIRRAETQSKAFIMEDL